ncbi:ABC transporter%2C ATP-binding component [Chlamydia trachomatis]|nr:ABC transporter%2C ATP-binding component [Chlamydia trachomatis]
MANHFRGSEQSGETDVRVDQNQYSNQMTNASPEQLQQSQPLPVIHEEQMQHENLNMQTAQETQVQNIPMSHQSVQQSLEGNAQVHNQAENPQNGFTQVFAPLSHTDEPAVAKAGKPTIALRDVTLVYPAQKDKPALSHVTLDIYPGEFAFVVGHSGSGKSTFLKLLTRELRATKGKVIVAGHDLTVMRNWKVPYLRRQIGTVYQDFKLLPDKTVYENVAFALECIGKPKSIIRAQVPEVLRLVGLGEKMSHYPDQLSGGEQQRVSVARAMVNRPPLLVCDEPTGNLDPAISLGIMKLLDRINHAGTTVVMATHDREMVDSMRKRVIALEAGQVVRDQEKGGYGFYGAL